MRGRRDIGRKPTNSVSAYEQHLLATQAKKTFAADGYARCIDHSEAAIRIDPDYAQAWALMGLCEFWFAPFAETAEDKAAFFDRAVDSVETAFRLDPNDPVALWSTAAMGSDDLIVRRDYIRRAVELAPNNSDILASGAWVSGFVGATGPEPLQWADRALTLNPTHPPWHHIAHGVAAYQAGEDLLAAEAFQRAPRMTESLLFHAAAEWRLGNFDTAKSLVSHHLAMAPEKTLVDHFWI